MAIIKRTCIDAIKNRSSLYDVVSTYVSLKRVGQNWKGLSPFTNEKTPSFFIHTHKNIFKCFSSGHAGDAIRFLQLKEHFTFQEAVEQLAHRFNVALEYEEDSKPAPELSVRKEVFRIQEIAADFFCQAFWAQTPEGNEVRRYWLEERQFTPVLARSFQIGLAPSQENALLEVLLKHKCSLEALKASGLFYTREGDSRLSSLKPRFRGRLMIPIKDVQGRIIAFSGRKLSTMPSNDPTAQAKYINSPETLLFHKSYVLFGLDQARPHAGSQPFYLVEGPLDVIRCTQSGLQTAVAPQGTAITEAQLETLRRYTTKLCVFLDGDSAGQKAALRLLPLGFKAALEVSFLPLPSGLDPDLFFLNKLQSASAADPHVPVLPKPLTAMEFLEKTLFANRHALKPHELSNALTTAYEILQHASSQIVQLGHLTELCSLLSIDASAVQRDFKHFSTLKHQQPAGHAPPSLNTIPLPPSHKIITAEQELLLLFLHCPELVPPLVQVIELEWIDTQTLYGVLLVRLINDLKHGISTNLQHVDEMLETDQEKDLVYTLLSQVLTFDNPVKIANQCLKKIFSQFIYRRREEIEHLMSLTSRDQLDAMRTLQQDRIQLRKLLQNPPQLPLANFSYSSHNPFSSN